MTTLFARSPLQSLPMATNRPTTRRRSVKQAFDEEDGPVSKRPKMEVTRTSKRGNSATMSAARASKAAYEESDDGFQFSRRTSRRTAKAQAEPVPDSVPEEDMTNSARALDALSAKPSSRRKKIPNPSADHDSAESKNRRRSARLSSDKEQLEVQAKGTKSVASKRTKKSVHTEQDKKKQTTPAPETQLEGDHAFKGIQTPTQNELQMAKKRDPNAQRIMLPFADTPVITRNKEMRKGSKESHRRSSTGLRGRRASSLIDSGMSNALPHSEVEVRDFYKYIEQTLPEPRRMRQLLTWCGARALPEKPSGDVKNANAIMAARAIQQELIDDFASKSELSDWFSREETSPLPVARRPNPQNEKNRSTLQDLEEEVKRLEEEKAAWETLASTSTPIYAPPTPLTATSLPELADIDASLLDPSQAAILSALQLPESQTQLQPSDLQQQRSTFKFTFTSPTALQAHLTALAESLETSIDLFADGVHKIEQYRQTAEYVADRVLETASGRLEERDQNVKEKAGSEGIGVGDVLRGLAGVLREQ